MIVNKQMLARKRGRCTVTSLELKKVRRRQFSQRMLLNERVRYLKEYVIFWIAVKGEWNSIIRRNLTCFVRGV